MSLSTLQRDLLYYLIPIIIIELAGEVFSIVDIIRTRKSRTQSNVIIWILIVGFISFGWIIYLLFGRIPKEREIKNEDWI